MKNLQKGLIFHANKQKKTSTKKSNVEVLVESAWKNLYRNTSPTILHATILNEHLEYMKEYLDRGADVNTKDFADWTPLHCAVYIGNVVFIKELVQRSYIFLHEKNDEGKTPI